MTSSASTRSQALIAALACAAFCVCLPALAQHQTAPPPARYTPAPIERRPPSPAPNSRSTVSAPVIAQRPGGGGGKLPNGEHLGSWFDQHSNLTPDQKIQALEREPGFHDLPPQTQQRERDQLTRLNNMPPEQRARTIQRNEVMERLTPIQQGQVRNAMQQWASLPPDSHRNVGRTFRIVRGMPPAERLAYLNSPGVRSQLTEQERDTLMHLMAVEPYLPPPPPVPIR